MRGKLSQPVGWAALLCLLTAVGCDRAEPDRAAAPEGTSSGWSTYEVDADAVFLWPEDPNHPRIRIDVEGPGVEGSIEIELMPELAPKTVPHLLALVREEFYDGTTFHRVIPDFMVQGGDPNSLDRDPRNDGRGGPEQTVDDEFGAAPFERGVVAMANKGRPDSGGSQFFIMLVENRELDGRYTVIGRVRAGMDVVDRITTVEIDRVGRWGPEDRPIENVVMTRVRTIEGAGGLAEWEDAAPGSLGELRDAAAVDGGSAVLIGEGGEVGEG